MKSRHCIIVMACKKYIPEVNALINSLDYVGNKEDVYLWTYGYPEEYLKGLAMTDWTFKLHIRIITEEEARSYGGEGEILCRKRYWYAAEIGKEYEGATLVLDADMVFTRDPWQFLEIAAKTGFILGTHKEQNKMYDHEHNKVRGEYIFDPTITNDKDLCNAPLFIDAGKYSAPLKRSWEIFCDGFPATNFKGPDMDAMNLCFLEAGLYNKIIKLSNHSWLGTNESQLKPYTRAVMKAGGLFTENGQEIWSFHGQYYKKKWRLCQLDNRHNCAAAYLKCNLDDQARGSMELLTSIFNKMCFEHKLTIPLKNYVHPELPYEG